MRVLGVLVAVLVALILAVGVTFVVGVRRHSPVVINAVRRVARTTKRLSLKSAGTAGAYASVIRHVGRRSQRQYETPVRAVATVDGFAIALPYGSDSDWVRNVLARSTAVVVHKGQAFLVDQPSVVPLVAVEDSFTPRDQRAHRLFAVRECLLVHKASPQPTELSGTAASAPHQP